MSRPCLLPCSCDAACPCRTAHLQQVGGALLAAAARAVGQGVVDGTAGQVAHGIGDALLRHRGGLQHCQHATDLGHCSRYTGTQAQGWGVAGISTRTRSAACSHAPPDSAPSNTLLSNGTFFTGHSASHVRSGSGEEGQRRRFRRTVRSGAWIVSAGATTLPVTLPRPPAATHLQRQPRCLRRRMWAWLQTRRPAVATTCIRPWFDG